MAWFASKGAKYYIRLTAKTISCSAACENSYAFNCRRVRSHRKPPARLRFTPAPSTTRPVIISQTGILALLRLCLMYFLIPIVFPPRLSSRRRDTNMAREKSRVAASRDCGAIAREANNPRWRRWRSQSWIIIRGGSDGGLRSRAPSRRGKTR